MENGVKGARSREDYLQAVDVWLNGHINQNGVYDPGGDPSNVDMSVIQLYTLRVIAGALHSIVTLISDRLRQ